MKLTNTPPSPVKADPQIANVRRKKPATRLLLVVLLLAALLIGSESNVLPALKTLALTWQANLAGQPVIATTPANGAANVPANTDIRVIFNQPQPAARLTFSPPVSGTSRWAGSTLVFLPDTPLAANTGYTAQLANGFSWQFSTRQPQLLFMAADAAGNDQLFALNPAGGPAHQLTHEEYGVFDYQLAPRGEQIAYAALRQDGGSDLWAITAADNAPSLLQTCPAAICAGAAWSPDGRRLLFEKRSLPAADDARLQPARLWWLDVSSGAVTPLSEDAKMLSYGAVWSPNGEWLSYVTPASQSIQVQNLADNRSVGVVNRLGGPAVWHPHSDALIVADVRPSAAGAAIHLFKATPATGELVDISGEGAAVEDSSPAWSPDGRWLAFTRGVAGASMGKQIWLMRPDGSEAHFLTNAPDIQHSLPRWSPDGHALSYQQHPLKAMGGNTSIWLMDVATGSARQLVANGNRPLWWP